MTPFWTVVAVVAGLAIAMVAILVAVSLSYVAARVLVRAQLRRIACKQKPKITNVIPGQEQVQVIHVRAWTHRPNLKLIRVGTGHSGTNRSWRRRRKRRRHLTLL